MLSPALHFTFLHPLTQTCKSKPWGDSELAPPLINVASYLLMNGTNVCSSGTVLHCKVHWIGAQTHYKRESLWVFFSSFLIVSLVKGWRVMLKKRNWNIWRCDVPLGRTCSREYKWKNHEVKYFATPHGHFTQQHYTQQWEAFLSNVFTDIKFSLIIYVCVSLSFNKNMPLWY